MICHTYYITYIDLDDSSLIQTDNMDKSNIDQLKTLYNALQQKVQQHSQVPAMEQERKLEIMQLLHDFNDVKDAAQIVLGALANLECKTIKEMHLIYNLPLNE
uniref:Uncharacterized protein n=1 Tax=Musca domestica TaxID=7370 RepID=A0A1I8M9P3_MUSDO